MQGTDARVAHGIDERGTPDINPIKLTRFTPCASCGLMPLVDSALSGILPANLTRRQCRGAPSFVLRCVFILLIAAGGLVVCGAGAGFRTERQFGEHYAKHGSEFGHISKAEYLHLAQQLRDTPVGGPILEIRRSDGTVSRFNKARGYFGAYNHDGTIRTFFIPAAGESYFRRQAER